MQPLGPSAPASRLTYSPSSPVSSLSSVAPSLSSVAPRAAMKTPVSVPTRRSSLSKAPKPRGRESVSPTKRSRRVSFANATPGSVSPRPKRPSPTKATRPSNNTSRRCDPLQVRNDRLGTLVRNLSESFHKAGSWEAFLQSFKDRSYLSPTVGDIDHPAAKLLQRWREEGVPVNTSSPPWSVDQKDKCIRRGCHPSATKHAPFLREPCVSSIRQWCKRRSLHP